MVVAVEDKFKASLVARARKRSVTAHQSSHFIVDGDPALGDSMQAYHVILDPATHHYTCTCYTTNHGATRARKMCSHVLAVLLHRQDQRSASVPSAGDGEVAAVLGDAAVAPRVHVDSEDRPEDAPGSGWIQEYRSPRGGLAGGVCPTGDSSTPSAHHPIFRSRLPEWVQSIRPHQWVAVQQIVEAFEGGAKAVVLDAPTGSGKTLIGRMVSIILGGKTLYVCSDKSLQDQFHADFDSAVLKGRANYTPTDAPSDSVNCGDCTLTSQADDDCAWCETARACPYTRAKIAAIRHELAVVNTSYLLAEGNGGTTAFGCQQRDLIIVDEADGLEQQLMGYVECVIGDRRATELDIGRPQFVTKNESIADWVRDAVVPKVDAAVKFLPTFSNDLRTIRKRQSLVRLLENLKYVEPGLRSNTWIFDGYNRGGATFKPVRVDRYGAEVLWRHAKRWLLMSATIISSDELAESLGLDGAYETVTVPMTFPVANRRIHIAGVADMTAKKADEEWPKLAAGLAKILEIHPSERILVHTVSFKLAEYIDAALLNRRVMTYRSASEREAVLAKFRKTDRAVLLAPSMARGVDLKDDDCRVVVVAKIPFPYLGDRQVSARMHTSGGSVWYSVATIRSLVQMTGRGVRSDDDWCVSYVLDTQFITNIWKRNKSMLPQWWKDSLNFEFNTKSLRA